MGSSFRFFDLPRELRDIAYSFMIMPALSYRKHRLFEDDLQHQIPIKTGWARHEFSTVYPGPYNRTRLAFLEQRIIWIDDASTKQGCLQEIERLRLLEQDRLEGNRDVNEFSQRHWITPIVYGVPSFLRVSRQFRAEIEPVLYSQCTIVSRTRFEDERDIIGIPTRYRHLIRALECRRVPPKRMLQKFPNLKKITVSLVYTYWTLALYPEPVKEALQLCNRLKSSLGHMQDITLIFYEDRHYGNLTSNRNQPRLSEIVSTLRGLWPSADIIHHGRKGEQEFAAKIHNLHAPIILIGNEYPAVAEVSAVVDYEYRCQHVEAKDRSLYHLPEDSYQYYNQQIADRLRLGLKLPYSVSQAMSSNKHCGKKERTEVHMSHPQLQSIELNRTNKLTKSKLSGREKTIVVRLPNTTCPIVSGSINLVTSKQMKRREGSVVKPPEITPETIGRTPQPERTKRIVVNLPNPKLYHRSFTRRMQSTDRRRSY